MILANVVAPVGQLLSDEIILNALHKGLDGHFLGQKVLVLIPDHTRSLPMPFLFRSLIDVLYNSRQLDFMVALGTHPPLSEEGLNRLVGITPAERSDKYRHVGLLNHAWDDSTALTRLGIISHSEVQEAAGPNWHPSLAADVEVRMNKLVLEYDHILIVGPTFPHEVAGFSGGAKYLFPGISGSEMINTTHWLGALAGVRGTIGIKETPMHSLIHLAAAMLKTPVTLVALVVEENALSGVFIGDTISAWSTAADLSAQRHIRWLKKPFQRVLSCAPDKYDELWTAAKAMYKIEPAVAVGGEVIIYAPHLGLVSRTHGNYIYEIGYHILPYFLDNWKHYQHIPKVVMAHSTHLRGSGFMVRGVERPDFRVTLASKIPPEECARLNLGYLDPDRVHIADWQDHEQDGILYVPRAGEILYRVY